MSQAVLRCDAKTIRAIADTLAERHGAAESVEVLKTSAIRLETLLKLSNELEGALINSEGKDFTIRADFVLELIAAIRQPSRG